VADLINFISHDRNHEDPTAKARWFQSLTIKERADLLCFYTDMILEINPKITEHKNAKPVAGRIRVLSKA
jgi:hypothetical protein